MGERELQGGGRELVEVVTIRGHCKDGEIDRYQVVMKIGFRLEDREDQRGGLFRVQDLLAGELL